MDKGFLRVTVVGEGLHGTTAKASFYFPTDPVSIVYALFCYCLCWHSHATVFNCNTTGNRRATATLRVCWSSQAWHLRCKGMRSKPEEEL